MSPTADLVYQIISFSNLALGHVYESYQKAYLPIRIEPIGTSHDTTDFISI